MTQSYYPLNVELHNRILHLGVSEEFVEKILSSWNTKKYPRPVRDAWRGQLREYLSGLFGCPIETYGFCYSLLSPELAKKALLIMDACDGNPWS